MKATTVWGERDWWLRERLLDALVSTDVAGVTIRQLTDVNHEDRKSVLDDLDRVRDAVTRVMLELNLWERPSDEQMRDRALDLLADALEQDNDALAGRAVGMLRQVDQEAYDLILDEVRSLVSDRKRKAAADGT